MSRQSIRSVAARAFEIPTEKPESDGTAQWSSTTLVTVELTAGEATGFGYTYSAVGAAWLVRDRLAEVVRGKDALDVPRLWQDMLRAVRNLGPPGIASMAVAAVDAAAWDLKAKLLGLPLVSLLGRARDEVAAYGSGGFTSYSEPELQAHCAEWAERGFLMVKMKVGRDPASDPQRVRAARQAVGPGVQLMTDANGAYQRKQALAMAQRFCESAGVVWLEEPVSSEDRAGLRLLRDQGPPGLAIAAGEYGYSAAYFHDLIAAGAVDVLQADATRCAGLSGFLEAAALARAAGLRLSSHCAPSLHLPACLAAPAVCHMEYFYDHMRIETRYLDGAAIPQAGLLKADASRPGLGVAAKWSDLEPFAV